MSFKKEKTRDIFLLDTNVENMFINEYMVPAPGDYVKVYLFALMYANLDVEFSNEDIAKHLSMDPEDVLKAWTYWERMGVVKKKITSSDNSLEYDVEFVLLKDMLYGNRDEGRITGAELGMNEQMSSREYKDMFARVEKAVGRVISGSEMNEILLWINDFGVSPEVVAFAFEFCAERKKKSLNYVEAVIRNWSNEGYRTIEEVQEYIGYLEGRAGDYKRVFRALGFTRNWTEEEKRIMAGWFDNMKFSIDTVLEACSKTSGISSPNINYVNRILENWHDEGGGPKDSGEPTTSMKMKYYEVLREREEQDAEDRKQEVYSRVPRIKEIEKEENTLGSKLSKIVVTDQIDKKEAIEEIRGKIDLLNTERAFLLTDNGFELDYMDVRYQCPNCRDTGMLETGERCQCFGEITAEKINLLLKTK